MTSPIAISSAAGCTVRADDLLRAGRPRRDEDERERGEAQAGNVRIDVTVLLQCCGISCRGRSASRSSRARHGGTVRRLGANTPSDNAMVPAPGARAAVVLLRTPPGRALALRRITVRGCVRFLRTTPPFLSA
jgi:hypothetical protein